MKTRILIVEDEEAIKDMIRFALEPAGFDIAEASNTTEAEKQIGLQRPHLILLDWMLPGMSGIDFAKQLKQNRDTQNLPIIMLTARAEEENKIKGLEIGADDYVTKPFSPRELMARIKTILRRGLLMSPEGVLQVDDLSLNTHNQKVSVQNNIIELTNIEYRLLEFFMRHPDRTYTRAQLLDRVWGNEKEVEERTVDVQIRRLRDQLKPFNYHHFIRTVRGMGYQFSRQPL